MTAMPPRAATTLDDISLLSLVNLVLRHRRTAVWLAFGLAFGVGFTGLLAPRTWTASSAFTPQGRKAPSIVSGLAAQFGLSTGGEPAESPPFYADLIGSRTLRAALVDTTYANAPDGLPAALGVETRDPALRRDAAVNRLGGALKASVNPRTNVVRLRVTLPSARIAFEVNERVLELLNHFNLETRQSRAAAERRFIEARLADARRELRVAEDQLEQFQRRNRQWQNSPELAFQAERLNREVTMQQQIFTNLAQAYEEAKIDEVRDTPVITVVEPPEMPLRPDPRGLATRGLLALLAGLALGTLLGALGSALRGERQSTDRAAVEEFARHRTNLAWELRRPWRLLLGGRNGPRSRQHEGASSRGQDG